MAATPPAPPAAAASPPAAPPGQPTGGPALDLEGFRDGSRWIHERPSSTEFAEWATQNLPVADGMDVAPWVPGITLIPQSEDVWVTIEGPHGPAPEKRGKRQVYVPYVKIETRVAYFWEWCRRNDYIGKIGPADVRRVTDMNSPLYNDHLPPGFFVMQLGQASGQLSTYMACSMRVQAWRRAEWPNGAKRTIGEGVPVLDAPAGTKMVPVTNRYGSVDDNLIMKAETGAAGRALGMAGILVLPGSGVATAEDMLEAQALESRPQPAASDAAALPNSARPAAAAPQQQQETPREEAIRKISLLEANDKDRFETLAEWAKGRGINFNDLQEQQLRGLIRRLDKELSEAGTQDQGS